MMWSHFSCYMNTCPFSVTNHSDRLLRTDMTHMVMTARCLCQQYVACNLNCFCGLYSSRHTNSLTHLPFMNHTSIKNEIIFTMSNNSFIVRGSFLHCFIHLSGSLHTHAIICKSKHIFLADCCNIRSFGPA